MSTLFEIMTTAAATVPPWITVAAARRVATMKAVDHLLVAEDGRLMGLVSTLDLDAAPPEDTVGACARRPPLCLDPSAPAERARHVMVKNRLGALPVVAGCMLVGLVTRDAVERALARANRPTPVAAEPHAPLVAHDAV